MPQNAPKLVSGDQVLVFRHTSSQGFRRRCIVDVPGRTLNLVSQKSSSRLLKNSFPPQFDSVPDS